MTADKTRYRYVPPREPTAEPVCLLDRETAARRAVPADVLFAEATAEIAATDGAEYRFHASPGTWERIEAFVREEGECCPFFAFEEWEEDGEIVLRIVRPAGREEGAGAGGAGGRRSFPTEESAGAGGAGGGRSLPGKETA